jgi:extracellular factor (EF) 3-hydroxypalmitic acid methyl ester biosynthesis protein
VDPEFANDADIRAHLDLPRYDSAPPPASEVSGVRRAPRETLPSGEVADYAALLGGQGRDVFFRPDRYQLRDLGPVGVSVELETADRKISCELFDVSQNGVAFAWPAELPVEVGTVVGEIVVRFDQYEAYRGEARASSVRREAGQTIVGASFVDGLMNIEDVLHLRDVKAWSGAGSQGIGVRDAPWRVSGHEQFKALVGELRLLLEDGRANLNQLEATLPWNVAHGDHDSPARAALIHRVRCEFVEDAIDVSDQIDQALRLAPRGERDALREYSLRHLHELLMHSPCMHRARHKPLGYPGDYEVMNSLYVNQFSGATLFAKAVNMAFVSTAAGRAVRERKNLIKAQLSALLDSAPRDRPVRILSIAAGPAQEIFELLHERETIPVRVEIVLFDQDKRALAFSYSRLRRVVSSKWRDRVGLVHLHDSIKHLLRGAAVFSGQGAFDAVYSCGLFDYLQRPTATSLCRSLYALVAPGGTLYVGNMVPECQSRWVMELHLDWYLVYRERSEMREFARLAAPDARIEILEEATRVNPFVTLTRE